MITKRLFLAAVLGLAGIASLLTACSDDMGLEGMHHQVEEGIPGELTLSLNTGDYEEHHIAARGTELTTEQHVHSAYIFVIDMKDEKKGDAHCPVLSRKYYYDLTNSIQEVTEMVENQPETFRVNHFKMQTLSCDKARIFAIINLGYSDVQGVDNDKQLLEQCDTLTSLKTLKRLSARLATITGEEENEQEVSVERMQGHHLMSGFFSTLAAHGYTSGHDDYITLEASKDTPGQIVATEFRNHNSVMRPLGSTDQGGTPAAIFAHRLDAKVTMTIEPDQKLKDIPGAYFKLTSWKVMNAPVHENIYWLGERPEDEAFAVSKTFRRDINPTPDGGWTFTYYQFENYNVAKAEGKPNASNTYHEIGSKEIADWYNKTYHLTGNGAINGQTVQGAFFGGEDGSESVYPNVYTNFAYTLREQEKKYKYDGNGQFAEEYVPNDPNNKDQEIFVKNVGFEFAPKNASYLLLTGIYYNPQEPVRRRKDTDKYPSYSFEEYPYLNTDQQPVKTVEEAAKRTRSAKVVYRVHLGYVGGENYMLNPLTSTSEKIEDFDTYKKKLNDYNVLRNNHYRYKLKIAGVENIKLEATRENGGNLLEQENQTGAEGIVVESQHFMELDSHYETRNLTIDFARMPENYDGGFSFGVYSPFERMRFTMKKKTNGEMGFFEMDTDKEVTSIRNHDLDWIHFAWHGTEDDPDRSLIDQNGNGIPYSQTYGGYEEQQSYLTKNSTLTHEKDETHTHQLLNALQFSEKVWTYFCKWKAAGKPDNLRRMTFTVYVDEYYYDFNPVTNEQVDWTGFCNKTRREVALFMENEELSADFESWYADAHVVIYQNAIQTLYATEATRGQIVPDVAFGIEGVDEFQAKYNCGVSGTGLGPSEYANHQYFYFKERNNTSSLDNGLYNMMQWWNGKQNGKILDWKTAEAYFNENSRQAPVNEANVVNKSGTDGQRTNRRGQWAVYSRNRDLNRNNVLDADEVRWFIPGVDQYLLCFLGGRPVFDNPLFEKEKAIYLNSGVLDWLRGLPLAHYMSSTAIAEQMIFWAEEGCSKGRYNAGHNQLVYGIRMGRMLTRHGVVNTGVAFSHNEQSDKLKQDPLYIVSRTRNGEPVPFNERVDGQNYYILLNKMNPAAFREYVAVGDLGHHTHEQKQNWLYREYVVARHKIGYTSFTSWNMYDRTPKNNGIPCTWWQVNGVYTDGPNDNFKYHGPDHSLAYEYYEEPSGMDLHHWRIPNLREAAIMSMSFPEQWFGGSAKSIVSGTKSDNLGPNSTNVPFWNIYNGFIKRMSMNEVTKFYVRSVRDVR